MVTVTKPIMGAAALPVELAGLSTDTKPTTKGAVLNSGSTAKLPNGSQFIEIDTGKIYLFDEDLGDWREF